jgi:hypothetical protein
MALTPAERAHFQLVHAFDDAVLLRKFMLLMPCADCTPDEKCNDHARDEDLIAGYRQQAEAALAEGPRTG